MKVTLTRPDPADPGLRARWTELAEASAAPAFRRWPWVGALLAERTPDPVLATVSEGGRTVAMALLNRRSRRMYLHASGDSGVDAAFVEDNGLLCRPANLPSALPALLRACKSGTVHLPGIDDTTLAAARRSGGILGPVHTRPARYVQLGPGYLNSLSANTRAQIRRSDRSYGPLQVTQAADTEQALDWLDRLVALHRAGWEARGVSSGFATEPVQRFVRQMVRLGTPDEVELLHVAAGERTVGYLLNLRAAGRVNSYQSGFDYAGARPHEKPGLSSHAAAIAFARDRGDAVYDLLAGAARYKTSLARDERTLHWVDWHPRFSVAAGSALLRRWLARG